MYIRWSRVTAITVLILSLHSSSALAQEIDWEPDIYPSDNLFPSVVLGTARVDPDTELFAGWGGNHLGDENGVVGAVISGVQKGDRVKLVIQPNEFIKSGTFEGVVREELDGDLLVHPKVSYDYNALTGVMQVAPVDVSMELFVNGESLGVKSETVTVRTVNDCLYAVEESGSVSDYSWLFSAYVNENHPWVDALLKEALETGIVSSFDAYQSGDDDQVLLQIFAIWNVMQRRGMRYSDITTTAAETDGVYSQHVRLLDQSMDSTQANCVDGTVLLAALLRKIGLRCSLALVPGHMYLAVDLSDEAIIGIETTLMGEQNLAPVDRKEFPAFDTLDADVQEAAWNSFIGALLAGTENLEQSAEAFESEDEPSYQLIDLSAARRMGILPISFRNR
jgi:hypothetical protein